MPNAESTRLTRPETLVRQLCRMQILDVEPLAEELYDQAPAVFMLLRAALNNKATVMASNAGKSEPA